MHLRSNLSPTHATTPKVIPILNNLGIPYYPLDDWEAGFQKIIELTTKSFDGLRELIQNKSVS